MFYKVTLALISRYGYVAPGVWDYGLWDHEIFSPYQLNRYTENDLLGQRALGLV